MFNTELPSGRRRLFVFVLAVFLVVGFTVRLLLVKWEGTDKSLQLGKGSSAPTGDQTVTASVPPTLSQAELDTVSQKAQAFLRAYTTFDFKNRSKWLNTLQGLTSDSFYQLLTKEAEAARPSGGVQATTFGNLERMDCNGSGTTAVCVAEMVVIEKDAKQSLSLERVYQLQLGKGKDGWVVEEEDLRGNFE